MSRCEKLTLGNNPSFTIYYDCFACRSQLVVSIDSIEHPNHDSGRGEANVRGWMRRKFHEGVDPWFCSDQCAYYSPQAVYCEESWAKEVKEYDYNKSIVAKIKGWFV